MRTSPAFFRSASVVCFSVVLVYLGLWWFGWPGMGFGFGHCLDYYYDCDLGPAWLGFGI